MGERDHVEILRRLWLPVIIPLYIVYALFLHRWFYWFEGNVLNTFKEDVFIRISHCIYLLHLVPPNSTELVGEEGEQT